MGKRFTPIGRTQPITVVGVAADVRLRQRLDLSDAAIGIAPGGLGPQLDVYLPYAQRANKAVVVLARVQGDPAAITPAVRSAIAALDPTLPAYDIAMLEARLAAQDQPSLALTAVTASYALLALFLAALGLFGLLAYTVRHRTQELGIRMALGATRQNVLLLVLREGVFLTGMGIAGGLLVAALLTRTMGSLLFGVKATDPIVCLSISALLMAVGVTACYLPARRATRVDPVIALRSE
jgi:predicted lysophospholipase L1 biosynthesis ABC-type transport system permease subunit